MLESGNEFEKVECLDCRESAKLEKNLNEMNKWVMNNVSYSYDVKTIVKNKRKEVEKWISNKQLNL